MTKSTIQWNTFGKCTIWQKQVCRKYNLTRHIWKKGIILWNRFYFSSNLILEIFIFRQIYLIKLYSKYFAKSYFFAKFDFVKLSRKLFLMIVCYILSALCKKCAEVLCIYSGGYFFFCITKLKLCWVDTFIEVVEVCFWALPPEGIMINFTYYWPYV